MGVGDLSGEKRKRNTCPSAIMTVMLMILVSLPVVAISSCEYNQDYEMMCLCWPGISSCFFLSEEPASQCTGDR